MLITGAVLLLIDAICAMPNKNAENNNANLDKIRREGFLQPYEERNNQCSICLEERTYFQTNCNHFFHA